jgi:acetyltransferase-like isoleucine patch superfamily enzyme
MFPNIGTEKSKPLTKPVVIGDDCLIGEYCAILKGSTIGHKCIIGVYSVVAGSSIPNGSIAVGNPSIVKNIK